MKKIYVNESFPHMLHGGDYNPDQWLSYPEILSEDMRLMKKANCNEMTVGIFAWSALEPEEGRFDFSWLDKIMDDVYKNGGRVILATPSGARPMWMAKKYPEVLRMNENGVRNLAGERENHCYTSPVYREKTAIINRKLAERYKDHPALYAWHISNEFYGECRCPLCVAAFREWLKKKYGTIEKLNHAWWSAFWAHTYTDWVEIDPPAWRGDMSTHCRNLDWKRFVTDQTADFIRNEAKALKEIAPNIPTTTNFMWYFTQLNYKVLSREIDFISWDSYPRWKDNDKDIDIAAETAMAHDLMRSFKHKPFLLMESTPSHVNWQPYNKLKRPGMHALSSLQTVAHGSDSVLYFQWRKSRGCSEKFHGAVVDHEGSENTRVFREVSALGERLTRLDEIVGAVTESKVAILYDVENQWALEDAKFLSNQDKKMLNVLHNCYKPLWKKGVNVEFISPEDDFSSYSFIINPMQYMVSNELGAKLSEYVKTGGTLLCTYTTGMVNENDLCHLGGFPGAGLKEVFGIWNEEIDTLYPEESNEVLLNDGTTVKAVDCCELIHAKGAEVLAIYNTDFYKGMPAVTVNQYGKGKAYYLAFRDEGDYTDKLINDILAELGISSDFDGTLPCGVTSHSRTDGENMYVFLENYTKKEQSINTALCWTDVETGENLTGSITLPPYGVLILKR